MLLAYPYPGNMRQLRHVLRLAGCTAEDGVITDADLDLPPFGGRAAEPDLAAAERATIIEALRSHGGRVTDAARALQAQPRHALPQDQAVEDRHALGSYQRLQIAFAGHGRLLFQRTPRAL